MNHAAFAEDALIVQRINKKPRGKQSIMWTTTFIDINGQCKEQKMVFGNNYPDSDMKGKPKGIKKMLEERKLWKTELNLDCKKCKKKKDLGRIDCCLKKIMASQPDFVSQKSTIVELIKGAAKKYAKNYCDYTLTGLQKIVLQALELIDIIIIRKMG
ncbi:14289_t:CDS:2 [Cetraspora pellucida]|uniref:14289_t:CDS:1 n=1 Tax=Cetraspora pellucida TaxID=1433469 RepID=A0A9N8YPY6_9GLOM|nr:14289_t:CDS:2 [Cetraspora pellucida]